MNNQIKSFIISYRKRARMIEENGLIHYSKHDNGYILLIVLIISAFLVSFTADFFFQTSIYIQFLKKARANLSCEYLGVSGFEMAKTILDVDRLGLGTSFLSDLNNDRNVDSYKDIWALEFPEIPMGDGTIKILIEDENAKININASISAYAPTTKYYGILQRFFINMGLPMDLADNILDWVDTDDSRSPYGAESSDYYQTLNPPYNSKNGPADSIEELLLVKGFTPEIFYGLGGGNTGLEKNLVDHNKGDVIIPEYKLEEINEDLGNNSDETGKSEDIRPIGKEVDRRLDSYLRTYGEWMNYPDETSKININTASYRVLMSLSNDISEDTVSEIIKKRQLMPFRNSNEISSFTGKDNTVNGILTVKSHIFKITVISQNSSGRNTLIYYYDRDNKKILYCTGEY